MISVCHVDFVDNAVERDLHPLIGIEGLVGIDIPIAIPAVMRLKEGAVADLGILDIAGETDGGEDSVKPHGLFSIQNKLLALIGELDRVVRKAGGGDGGFVAGDAVDLKGLGGVGAAVILQMVDIGGEILIFHLHKGEGDLDIAAGGRLKLHTVFIQNADIKGAGKSGFHGRITLGGDSGLHGGVIQNLEDFEGGVGGDAGGVIIDDGDFIGVAVGGGNGLLQLALGDDIGRDIGGGVGEGAVRGGDIGDGGFGAVGRELPDGEIGPAGLGSDNGFTGEGDLQGAGIVRRVGRAVIGEGDGVCREDGGVGTLLRVEGEIFCGIRGGLKGRVGGGDILHLRIGGLGHHAG